MFSNFLGIKERSRRSPSPSDKAEKTLEVIQEGSSFQKQKLPPLEKAFQTREPEGPPPSPTKQPVDFYLIYSRKGSMNDNMNSSQISQLSDFDSLKIAPKALRGKRAGSVQPTRIETLERYE